MRINTILSDKRMKIVSGNSEDINLKDWLTNYIGDDQAKNGAITIIDLSLMPTEAVHLITAVIARIAAAIGLRFTRRFYCAGGNSRSRE